MKTASYSLSEHRYAGEKEENGAFIVFLPSGETFGIYFGQYVAIKTKEAAEKECEMICRAVNEYDQLKAKNYELLQALKNVRQWYEENQAKYLGTYTPVVFSEALSAIHKAETL